jgi:hypothetical protein
VERRERIVERVEAMRGRAWEEYERARGEAGE